MRTMYDSTQPAKVPAGAQLVAGYVDGPYKWSDEDWGRFPGIPHVGICVNPADDLGDVLDVEQGDATPAHVPAWLQLRRKAGVDPTVYCSASVQGQIAEACRQAGVAQPHYWIALWNRVPSVEPGHVAHQYLSGPSFDTSAVADVWPGVDPEPTPVEIPQPEQEAAAAVVVSLGDLYRARCERLTDAAANRDQLTENLATWTAAVRQEYPTA